MKPLVFNRNILTNTENIKKKITISLILFILIFLSGSIVIHTRRLQLQRRELYNKIVNEQYHFNNIYTQWMRSFIKRTLLLAENTLITNSLDTITQNQDLNKYLSHIFTGFPGIVTVEINNPHKGYYNQYRIFKEGVQDETGKKLPQKKEQQDRDLLNRLKEQEIHLLPESVINSIPTSRQISFSCTSKITSASGTSGLLSVSVTSEFLQESLTLFNQLKGSTMLISSREPVIHNTAIPLSEEKTLFVKKYFQNLFHENQSGSGSMIHEESVFIYTAMNSILPLFSDFTYTEETLSGINLFIVTAKNQLMENRSLSDTLFFFFYTLMLPLGLILLTMYIFRHLTALSAVMEDLTEYKEIFTDYPAPLLIINKNHIIEKVNQTAIDAAGYPLKDISAARAIPGILNTDMTQNSPLVFTSSLGEKNYSFSGKKLGRDEKCIFTGSEISEKEFVCLITKAMNATKEGIIITDPQGKILYVNRGFEKRTGYTLQEIEGENIRIIRSKLHNQSLFNDLWLTIKQGKSWRGKLYNRGKAGNYYWEDVSISPLISDSGAITGFISVQMDYNTQMDEEKKLVRERKEAIISSKQKSKFLANMSHEIRTPMNAIIGFTDLILEIEKSPEVREQLEIIKFSSNHLLNLINDILILSKIEADKIQIKKQYFDLKKMISKLYQTFEGSASEKGISFRVSLSDSVPELFYGDEFRLNQILINILSNAFKFTLHGKVDFIVTVKEMILIISIADTGVGIPRDKISQIFAPFAQAEDSTERIYGGTGLGLTISKKLTELMGGTLTVESEIEKGSVFSVQLPVTQCRNQLPEADSKRDQKYRKITESWLERAPKDSVFTSITTKILSHLPEKADFLEESVSLKNRENIAYTVHDILSETLNLGLYELSAPLFEINHCISQSHPDFSKIKENLKIIKSLAANIPPLENSVTIPVEILKKASEKRILIAEDNEINQKLLQTILNKYNMQFVTVSNGREALLELRENSYDILLLDMQMPVMDGEETISYIRKEMNDKKLYVIAVTANAMAGNAYKYIHIGCNDYISKPIDRHFLIEKICRYSEKQYVYSLNKESDLMSEILQLLQDTLLAPDSVQPDKIKRIIELLEEKKEPFFKEAAVKLKEVIHELNNSNLTDTLLKVVSKLKETL